MDSGPCCSWLSSMFFKEYLLTDLEFVAARSFFDQSILDGERGRVKLHFELGSVQYLVKEDLVDSFKVLHLYMAKRTSVDAHRTFHNRLSPMNLSSVGVKYLVVAKELVDKLSALMYGLDWDHVAPDASLLDPAVIWEQFENKDIIILNDFLYELISELDVDETIVSPAFQTPPKDSCLIAAVYAPSFDKLLSTILFRILVIRQIVCALLVRSRTSHFRINNVSFLFKDRTTFHNEICEYLAKLSSRERVCNYY